MWYTKENDSLDRSRPILAIGKGVTSILVPQINTNSYEIIGYNWLNIRTGKYTSSCTFKSLEEALLCRSTYKLVNGVIKEEI